MARPPLGAGPTPPGITARLEPVAGAEPYPARHEVRDALLVDGGERVPVVVKRIRRDFRQGEGNTRAERAVRIARHLASRGIDTPEPLGVEVTPEESVLVVRKVEGAVQIRAFFLRRTDPTREQPAVRVTFEQVVEALGRFARRLHEAGVFFRDFTDGNILVTEGERGPRLWLVDLDRARIRRGPLRIFNRLRDLARPGLVRAEDRQLLLRSYWDPEPVPVFAPLVHGALKVRIDAWNRLKAVLRPWRRRGAMLGAGKPPVPSERPLRHEEPGGRRPDRTLAGEASREERERGK